MVADAPMSLCSRNLLASLSKQIFFFASFLDDDVELALSTSGITSSLEREQYTKRGRCIGVRQPATRWQHPGAEQRMACSQLFEGPVLEHRGGLLSWVTNGNRVEERRPSLALRGTNDSHHQQLKRLFLPKRILQFLKLKVFFQLNLHGSNTCTLVPVQVSCVQSVNKKRCRIYRRKG